MLNVVKICALATPRVREAGCAESGTEGGPLSSFLDMFYCSELRCRSSSSRDYVCFTFVADVGIML